MIAVFLPQVMGGGYGWLQLTLDGQLPLLLLVVLVPAKILATSLTITSGGSGGVFAPSLVIGGMTGAIFASSARGWRRRSRRRRWPVCWSAWAASSPASPRCRSPP